MIRTFFCCVGAVILLMTGCGEQPGITVYEVPKTDSGLDRLKTTSQLSRESEPQSAENLPDSRMVVGLAMRPDATWTFKILGEKSIIDAAESDWKEFFAKLQFDDAGQPKFQVPEMWIDKGTRRGMFSEVRTLLIDEGTDAKMEISSLSAGQGIKMNVDRWRGQLGLAPSEGDVKLPKIPHDGGELLLFDETGKFKGRGGPMSRRPPRPSSPAPRKVSQPTIDFDAPEGWDAGKTSSIVVGRFQKKDGDQEVELTIAKMPPVNEWNLNVRTWAASIGLKDWDDTKISEKSEAVQIDGVDGNKIVLSNDENKRALMGIMFKKQNTAWLAKLIGDQELVTASEKEFDAFWQSFKTNSADSEK